MHLASASRFDLIIVGGGAAGVFAALQFKTLKPNKSVLILEGSYQPLGKVRISGGGRCNVTHNTDSLPYLLDHYPRGKKELASVFSRFMPQDTIRWFEARGVPLKTETDRRVFPVTDSSQSIMDCLLNTLKEQMVALYTEQPVREIIPKEGGFLLKTPKTEYHTQGLLIASGSNPIVWKQLQAMGQPMIAPVPSLFTFQVKHPLLTDLAGVSFPEVRVQIGPKAKDSQQGPLLITHWGLSGPVILKCSAVYARELYAANYQHPLLIDFCPELAWADLESAIASCKREYPHKLLKNQCPVTTFPKRYWERLTHSIDAGETVWADLSKRHVGLLQEALKRQLFQLSGKGVFKEEFVTAGGVDRRSIDFKTMASKSIPGLYFAGEVIDVDGLTGGFNFQNAWATATMAAQGLASYK